jgi:uncharacterized Ntn-hydrolase superfamily protein
VIVATYSIAACDLDASQWGVAVQSKFLAVGSVVSWAEPRVGAIATQAYAKPALRPRRALFRDGATAEETVEQLVAETTAATSGSRHRRPLGRLRILTAQGATSGSVTETASVTRRRGKDPRRSGTGRAR